MDAETFVQHLTNLEARVTNSRMHHDIGGERFRCVIYAVNSAGSRLQYLGTGETPQAARAAAREGLVNALQMQLVLGEEL